MNGRNRPQPNMNYAHLMRNLTSELIVYKQIRLTRSKAQKLQRHFERVVTLAKDDTLFARRRARNMMVVTHRPEGRDPLRELFLLVKRYKQRRGGYTRMLKLGLRAGDNAPLVSLQLV